ncbi:hypothetical protein NX059_009071 [Plenodomus lindquistii]|nr:hypothetical protein NX059_009071 [Plenodomus lindquistii]
MAIHPGHPGLKTEVLVNGRALKEYDDDDEGEPKPGTVTKYIEAEADARYSISYHVPPQLFESHDISVKLDIDGVNMRNPSIGNDLETRRIGASSTIYTSSAIINGKRMGQPFRFTHLDTCGTSHSLEISLQSGLEVTGTISIFFHLTTRVQTMAVRDRLPSLQTRNKIPEKLLKGSTVSLSTTLGPLQEKPSCRRYNHTYIHGKDNPFAVFVFKYRSLAALKSLRIIPRSPSPIPLEDRAEEDLSPAEMLSLLKRLKAEKTQAQKLKRERAELEEEGEGSDVEIVDGPSSKRQRLPSANDVIIVLD